MPTRRGFFRSLLGLFGATALPEVPKAPPPKDLMIVGGDHTVHIINYDISSRVLGNASFTTNQPGWLQRGPEFHQG